MTYRTSTPYRDNKRYRNGGGIYTVPALSQLYKLSAGRASKLDAAVSHPWAIVNAIIAASAVDWSSNKPIVVVAHTPWGEAAALLVASDLSWRLPDAVSPAYVLLWGKPTTVDPDHYALSWQDVVPLNTASNQPWAEVYPLNPEADTGWRWINHHIYKAIYRNTGSYRDRKRYRALGGIDIALDGATVSSWAAPAPTDTASNLPWGEGQRLWPPITPVEWTSDTTPIDQNPAPPDPDIAEHYEMATDLTVKDVATGTALSVDGVAISLDIDSFAWKLSCRVLNSASMALCQPPALISVSTMGYEWQFVVESYTRTRDMKMTWQLSASSQSRQLDAPWVAPGTHLQTTPINFKQAVEACLPAGWTADWHASITDYTIPANAWSYSGKTNKAALADVLDAIGAVVVPDLSTKTLHIQPRYKLAPWEYNDTGINPDAIINQAMILSESGEYRPGQTVNGVWVSGSNDTGVVVEVKRAGTAGDELAEDVYHDLITASTAGQQRGKQIIAAAGSKTLVTLETIITDEMASPGLVLPGMMVEVQSDDTWRGIVLSCDVKDPGAARITQTLTIERSHLS